ncbi:conjugal transfer protein TraV [Enterobacter hormaechei]|nr:conjugal transfer protein TraV [Enterobacter hormaechei]
MCSIHLTPRCRRPVKGQVRLSRLMIDVDGVEFVLPSRHFRTDSAVNSRAVYATDRRAGEEACGLLLALNAQPRQLVTTAIWQVNEPGEPVRESHHVVQWLLPEATGTVLSDDTWLWPEWSDPPQLSPGDWPVLDITPSAHARIARRGLTIIDTRSREGRISRRFQTFPLVALAPGTQSARLPDVFTPLK